MLTPATRFVLRLLFFPMCLFVIMRGAFWWLFHDSITPKYLDLLHAWSLGLRYDLRVLLVFALPTALLINLRFFDPRWSKFARKFWQLYWVFIITFCFSFYLFDFGYYSYLKAHTNATALRFLVDWSISFRMLWESYPVLKAFLLIAFFAFIYGKLFKNVIMPAIDKSVENVSFKKSITNGLSVFIFFIAGLYGKFSFYPLRWSDAYFTNDAFVSSLAINPIHYFIDTLKYRETEFDVKKVKTYLNPVKKYLGLPADDGKSIDFARNVSPTQPPLNPPINVVVIVMESMAAYKSGLFANPANATPYLDEIARKGVLFRNHYVPSEGTARSIFGIMTAIPDVNTDYTSSRNPMIASQNLIINSFSDFKKFYFLGGSTSWGNIRGLLSYNIPDMEIVEEGSFKTERSDVWGISDLDLFKEAHSRFEKQSGKPFFAVIQTAGFHRPYTIPTHHDDFKVEQLDDATIKAAGFISNEEYNSLRFQDYSLGRFFQLAAKSSYFQNTLFVIQGDHGLPDNDAKNLSKGEIYFGLSRWHVPLVFFSPRLFSEPMAFSEISSELDIMTSVASLTGTPHKNTTLGRNLFGEKTDNRYAFLYLYYDHPPGIGIIDNQFYLKCNARLTCDGLFDYTSTNPDKNLADQMPEKASEMQSLTFGLYESAKYLLYNNPNPLIKK